MSTTTEKKSGLVRIHTNAISPKADQKAAESKHNAAFSGRSKKRKSFKNLHLTISTPEQHLSQQEPVTPSPHSGNAAAAPTIVTLGGTESKDSICHVDPKLLAAEQFSPLNRKSITLGNKCLSACQWKLDSPSSPLYARRRSRSQGNSPAIAPSRHHLLLNAPHDRIDEEEDSPKSGTSSSTHSATTSPTPSKVVKVALRLPTNCARSARSHTVVYAAHTKQAGNTASAAASSKQTPARRNTVAYGERPSLRIGLTLEDECPSPNIRTESGMQLSPRRPSPHHGSLLHQLNRKMSHNCHEI
jgi:hypothetical protein